MLGKIRIPKQVSILLLLLIASIAASAQLPQCNRLYLDQVDNFTFTSTQKIYEYDPGQPVSATNPVLNTILLPSADANGLTIGEVLGSASPTITFYTVLNDQYWYYNPTTLAWVNTTHFTGSGGSAVNIASGGGFIYNLDGNAGDIYKYDGTGNGSFLINVPDFAGEGPYDLLADCAGNFYLLNATGVFSTPFLRKYNSSGVLVQSWVVNNPNGYSPAGGFGIIGPNIYLDDIDQLTFSLNGIVSGSIGASSINLTTVTAQLPPYNNFLAGDLGSCQSGVPVSPDVVIATTTPVVCSGTSVTYTTTINAGGTSPTYRWFVNGNPVAGATASTFTYIPNDGDVVTCELTSSLTCVSTPTGLSNPITMIIDNGASPTLTYDPDSLCVHGGQVIPTFTPWGGSFISIPSNTSLDASTGTINLNTSSAGTYVITYSTSASSTCPVKTTMDTIIIFPTPEVSITMDVTGSTLCLDDSIRFLAPKGLNYVYEWSPAKYFPYENNVANIKGSVAGAGEIHLTITNAEGCSASDSIEVKPIPCCNVMIPTAFSPNGDNINDVFKVNSSVVQKINQLSIYNRYGQRVFYTNDQSKVWDGTYNNKPADAGVYYYYLSYSCADGNDIIKKGNLTLIR